jgi:hypothetical protein
VIRKIKSEASDEDMIKNPHFVVELGREIKKRWLHKRKFGPCRARRGKRVPISGVGKEVRGLAS